ncbi:hypothetical protein [Modestobacter sp. NPDC049651]|uniref:hypothetical protein n=1 Tax=unclassified Modestobacter TaxID=2643866 RepID=UPI0033C7EB85
MTTTPLPEVPVRSPGELTRRWEQLLTPPAPATRQLWVAWFDADGLMCPLVVPVDDLPVAADPALVPGLLALHEAVTGRPGFAEGHVAFALRRPGTALVGDDDLRWGDLLADEVADHLDGTWSLHVAAGGGVTPVTGSSSWRCG